MNAALVSGLNGPEGIAVSGSNLFVANSLSGTIGEYDAATGTVVNAALISGLRGPTFISIAATPITVPEPGTLTLLGAGLASFAFYRRRRTR